MPSGKTGNQFQAWGKKVTTFNSVNRLPVLNAMEKQATLANCYEQSNHIKCGKTAEPSAGKNEKR